MHFHMFNTMLNVLIGFENNMLPILYPMYLTYKSDKTK